MKSSKQILSHLSNMPQFGSLVQHTCYQKFMALLPPRFQKAVAFIYIKNRTLFIALSHPGYKMELNYNKELFKELLATLRQHTPECREQVAEEVILFNSKFHTPTEKEHSDTVPYYSELSSGTFELDLEEKELKEKFLHTQKIIEENLNRSVS